MSWHKMNHYELQAMRKTLMLDVKEAADHIGQCSARAWQHWETGRSMVPDDVETEIYGLISIRAQVIDNMTQELGEDLEFGVIKYFKTFDSFIETYPKSNVVGFRLYQSIAAYAFGECGEVELDADAKINKKGYLHKFFSKTTKEQIESQKQENRF